MQLAEHAVTAAAYALADRTLTRALLIRVREDTLRLLSSEYTPLPAILTDEVLASGDPELLSALASSIMSRGDLFHRLAALGDPALAVELYGAYMLAGTPLTRSPEQRRAVWEGAAATSAHPGWRGKGGLVTKLLAAKHPNLLLPALDSPFTDLVTHALTRTGDLVTAEDQLRTCRAVLARDGVPTLLAMAEPPVVRRSVAAEVRRACASAVPDKALEEAISKERTSGLGAAFPAAESVRDAQGARKPAAAADTSVRQEPPSTRTARSKPKAPATTDELIARLRDTYARRYLVLPEDPGVLDWESLIAAHRERPFTAAGLETLWQQESCPEELAVLAFAANSARTPAGAVYWPMLTAVGSGADNDESLRVLLPPGVACGAFPVNRVLSDIRPARNVLWALPHSDEQVRTALTAHVMRLGPDFATWRALYALLPRFGGSVPELIDAALHDAPKHQDKAWPKPLGPEFPHRRSSVGRTGWLHLFERADAATQHALSEHMDGRTIQYLLLWHHPDPALRDHLVRTHGTAILAGLASHWNTPAEVIEQLIPYDDPEVNAALFLYTNLTDAQRRHILAGRRWASGDATAAGEHLPLTAALVDGLRESARRNWLLPVCESGDPTLCRVLLGSPRVKVHTQAQQLHMLVRLWERQGPQEVRALLDETDFPGRRPGKHPLPPQVLKTARQALDAADGLAVLRAEQAEASAPAGQAEFLRVHGMGPQGDELARSLGLWREENGPEPVPWAALIAAHHTQPLHDRLLVGLAELDDCPDELTAAAVPARLRLSHSSYSPRRGSRPPTVSEMLKKLPLPVHDGKNRWLTSAYEAGHLTLSEILQDAFPAKACAAFLGRSLGPAPESRPVTEDIRQTRLAVAELARRHLGDDPEAWALTLSLIPGFEGTLPQLLATAGAVLS